ncbi:YbjN domain-containing protein [Schaalia sp. ZJ405]|uniref:YbjN domain-containing protein n=1 Tax=unclassified Schaalia TaxID=2691889 RepID=UPI0013EC6F3D|nr:MULTISPECIES: YbjN domain-containing protein [unclassified Schaalia]QPK81848.1 YbjN domain-containing protein [Schaalia sp. ZJ405]
MTESQTPAVTLDRVSTALRSIGLTPFIAGNDQVAAIFTNRTIRIIMPPGHPAQGIAEWPRSFNMAHRAAVTEAVVQRNATTYIPKITTSINDQGFINIRMHHVFNWVVGASDEQLESEVRHFIIATIATMNFFDEQFPDPWTKETPNA